MSGPRLIWFNLHSTGRVTSHGIVNRVDGGNVDIGSCVIDNNYAALEIRLYIYTFISHFCQMCAGAAMFVVSTNGRSRFGQVVYTYAAIQSLNTVTGRNEKHNFTRKTKTIFPRFCVLTW